MPTYQVILSAIYEFEAPSEEAAYYMAVDFLKSDLPENRAPLEADITVKENN